MARTKQTTRIHAIETYRIQENEPGGTESEEEEEYEFEEEEESESEEEEQAAAESTTHDQPHDGKYAWDAGMRQSGKLAAIGTGQYIFTSETEYRRALHDDPETKAKPLLARKGSEYEAPLER